jgi:hypothetical protein
MISPCASCVRFPVFETPCICVILVDHCLFVLGCLVKSLMAIFVVDVFVEVKGYLCEAWPAVRRWCNMKQERSLGVLGG